MSWESARRAETFDRVLEEHGGALARLAGVYERDPARREDLLQEICLALWRALPKFRGEASLRTFVFRVAHNRGATHRARRGRERRREAPVDQVHAGTLRDPAPGPESVARERERGARLRAAVRGLPLALRQAMVLSLEGLPHREIGEVLGVSENAVAVRLSRARAALREELCGRGAGSAPEERG